MTPSTVACAHCGQRNRVPAGGRGKPRCAKCRQWLPWIVSAGDRDFAEGVESASVPALVDFWATWCGPCKIEIPWFVEFAEQHQDDGLVVLGLSIDDTAAKIQAFAEEYNVNYPMLVGLDREDFQEAYGPIWGIPMTFFIDREGTLCRTHTGIANREEFEKDIADLL